MEELPIYIPHSRICHMPQYHCCKHRQTCRLFPVCSQINLSISCNRDCPNCTYPGCSLPLDKRLRKPVYIQGVIQGDRLDLGLAAKYWREQSAHKKRHLEMYIYYNCIFGDLLERRRKNARNRYWSDPERAREIQRKYYRKKHPSPTQIIPEKYLPECGLSCSTCPHDDCILPENWLPLSRSRIYYQEHPEYFQQYRLQNKDKRSDYNKNWYQEHKDEKLAKQKAHRADAAIRQKRAEYDKQYRENHRDTDRKKHRRYYQRHKKEINARKRAKRAETSGKEELKNGSEQSSENPGYCEA